MINHHKKDKAMMKGKKLQLSTVFVNGQYINASRRYKKYTQPTIVIVGQIRLGNTEEH
jgi:hypothetical protein